MERRQNYSRKREAILQTIRSTNTHPSADWIYQQLKPEYPDMSLGTVYRNLARFEQEGTIVLVSVVNGQERWDADTHPHAHFICRCCHSVQDLCEVKPDLHLDSEIQKSTAIKWIFMNCFFMACARIV